jgi:fibrillarin-like pre-rRNA processing protein
MKIIDGTLVSPGKGGVYGERTLGEWRIWDPYRSKLAALVLKGVDVTLDSSVNVLYLGAANGTTVSHVADYAGTVYAIEFAPRPMQDLIEVARRRKNIVPIMADVNRMQVYDLLIEPVDFIYQDVAQPNQAAIAVNHLKFLKKGGIYILMLKTRSVNVREDPKAVCDASVKALEEAGLVVDTVQWLDPYHRDHAALVCRLPGE